MITRIFISVSLFLSLFSSNSYAAMNSQKLSYADVVTKKAAKQSVPSNAPKAVLPTRQQETESKVAEWLASEQAAAQELDQSYVYFVGTPIFSLSGRGLVPSGRYCKVLQAKAPRYQHQAGEYLIVDGYPEPMKIIEQPDDYERTASNRTTYTVKSAAALDEVYAVRNRQDACQDFLTIANDVVASKEFTIWGCRVGPASPKGTRHARKSVRTVQLFYTSHDEGEMPDSLKRKVYRALTSVGTKYIPYFSMRFMQQ